LRQLRSATPIGLASIHRAAEKAHSRKLSWLLRSSFVLLEVAFALLGEPEVHRLARAVLEL